MSREVKRVPLDFDWPLHKVWDGYLLPANLQSETCTQCGGRGQTSAAAWVQACAHMILMLDDDLADQRRGRPMHPYFADFYTTAYGTRPSADIRQLGTGLAGREGSPFGHDSIDGWSAYSKIVAAAGLDPKVWGVCPGCAGRGSTESYPGQAVAAEAWTPTEPPAGEGWQMWETVSEGSPISPVLETPEQLAAWLAVNTPETYEQWLAMIHAGHSIGSGVITGDGRALSGVEAVSEL